MDADYFRKIQISAV